MGHSTFLVFFYSILLSFATLTFSQSTSQLVFYSSICGTSGNYTANSNYKANLNRLVSRFSSLTDFNYGFFNLSEGEAPDDVHSIALCRGDQNQNQCKTCLNYTATELERSCPVNKEAIAWSEFCSVRYANRDIYGQLEAVPPRTCAYNVQNATNPDEFNRTLSHLLNNLRSTAAAEGPLRKYAVGNASAGDLQTVYAMVQCTPDMDPFNCSNCLTLAMQELENCCYGRIGCRVLRPTCFLRFESNPFFNQTAVALPSQPPATPPTSTGVPLPSPITSPTSPPTSTGVPRPSPVPSPTSPPPTSTGAPPPSPVPSTPTSPFPNSAGVPLPSTAPSTPTSPQTSRGGKRNDTARTVIIVIASVLGVLMMLI